MSPPRHRRRARTTTSINWRIRRPWRNAVSRPIRCSSTVPCSVATTCSGACRSIRSSMSTTRAAESIMPTVRLRWMASGCVVRIFRSYAASDCRNMHVRAFPEIWRLQSVWSARTSSLRRKACRWVVETWACSSPAAGIWVAGVRPCRCSCAEGGACRSMWRGAAATTSMSTEYILRRRIWGCALRRNSSRAGRGLLWPLQLSRSEVCVRALRRRPSRLRATVSIIRRGAFSRDTDAAGACGARPSRSS